MTRVRLGVGVLGLLLAAACGDDGTGGEVAVATTTTVAIGSTATSAVSTTASTSTTTTAVALKAATALIAPDTVAGVPLGATKSEAIAVLGTPTRTGQDTDVGGKKYDYLRWELDGNRGLSLNFRTPSATSPRLTDWMATAKGPRTAAGVQVGDPAAKVVAAYGPLQPFCCDATIASVKQGPGRMVVVVPNGGNVTQIIGGDESFWSKSIAD